MSLFKFKRFVACFVDDNGDYIGKKVFKRSKGALGHKDRWFEYDDGFYNIVPSVASRLKLAFYDLFWDSYVYIYRYGNPDPVSLKMGEIKPVMDAKVYKVRMKNKLVDDLNKIAMGGFKFDWRWLFALGIGILVVWFFLSGGQIPFISAPASAPASVPAVAPVTISEPIIDNIDLNARSREIGG